MKNIKFFMLLALIGLFLTSLGCASNKSEAARTNTGERDSYTPLPKGYTGVYLGPEEKTLSEIEADEQEVTPQSKKKKPRMQSSSPASVKAKACYNVFRQAYGEAIIGKMQKSSTGADVIVINGKEIPLVGGTLKDVIYSSDLATTLSQPYPLDPKRPDTPDGVRPGRIRNYTFLEALYGATQAEVQKQIVSVNFCGKEVPFSKNAGAAQALQRVSAQLEKILKAKPELRKYCVNDGGFYWRKIAGSQYLSPHSYGIAIDLCTKYATYWRWQKNPNAPHPQQKNYPHEIVKAFEDNGFIWGGKWHEYDIMHFEYRPEIILLSKSKK